jgi:hypothetical protein
MRNRATRNSVRVTVLSQCRHHPGRGREQSTELISPKTAANSLQAAYCSAPNTRLIFSFSEIANCGRFGGIYAAYASS